MCGKYEQDKQDQKMQDAKELVEELWPDED